MASFVTTRKLAGLIVHMYNKYLLYEWGNNGQNCANYVQDFIVY